jgi:2-C-methyl-D-erythritol 4-phosphate cytidylyltransferase
MKIVAIITAGGSGKRLPGKVKKQFLLLDNLPLLYRSILPFYEINLIDKIIISLPKDEFENEKNAIPKFFDKKEFAFVVGGKERQDSIFNALKACGENTDLVLIHDGVRPLIKKNTILDLIDLAEKYDVAIPVSPVKNTIKKIADGFVEETVPRENLVNVFTPQVFDYQMIMRFYEKAKDENKYFTDDAGICEYYHQKIKCYLTDSENIKITDKLDLIIAEQILNKRKKEMKNE